MSTLKTYFRRKHHRYETQADLQGMSVLEILEIDPDDVGFYIKEETGGITLPDEKRRAMLNLLAYKKAAKKYGKDKKVRDANIRSFLTREGIGSNPEVESLIMEAHREVLAKAPNTKYEVKALENRLRTLKGEAQVPLTDEEAYDELAARLKKLGMGSTRKNRHNRRSRRSRRSRHAKRKTHRRRK